MTAPRPVEPVVGMEYDGLPLGMFLRCRIVAMTAKAVTYQPLGECALTLTVTRADFMRSWERCRPVLWTVGPHTPDGAPSDDDVVKARLGVVDMFDFVAYFAKVCGCSQCGRRVALWPTRAAALAAGKAFGWERPVARRVVRKG